MFTQPALIEIKLPPWLESFAQSYSATTNLAERMSFVIEASQRNIDERTGGPFAAAVFECGTGRLLALGVNLVSSQGLSILHAETVAITLAQRRLGSYNLAAAAMPECELICSCEPCAMCFGAITWSGVRHVVTAASKADAEQIGFDEGDKPADWQQSLRDRHIAVITGVERDQAAAVLIRYSQQQGVIYNPDLPH